MDKDEQINALARQLEDSEAAFKERIIIYDKCRIELERQLSEAHGTIETFVKETALLDEVLAETQQQFATYREQRQAVSEEMAQELIEAQQRIAELTASLVEQEPRVSLKASITSLTRENAELRHQANAAAPRLAACQSKLEATSLNGHREMERRVALQERLAEVVAALDKTVTAMLAMKAELTNRDDYCEKPEDETPWQTISTDMLVQWHTALQQAEAALAAAKEKR